MLNTKIKEFEGKLIQLINESGLEPTIIDLVMVKLQPEIKFAIEQTLKAEQEYMKQQEEAAQTSQSDENHEAIEIYPEDLKA